MYDIQQSSLFSLLQASKRHILPKGQVIQFSDNRMFLNLVSKGYVKRYLITDDGQESIQVVYGPEDSFPLTPIFSALFGLEIYKGDEIMYYEALTDVELYSVSKQDFLDAFKSNESLYKDLLYVAGKRLESNIFRLENTSLRSAERKIVDVLLHYANRFGIETSDGVCIQLPLTHQTIASMLNIARETVSLHMSELHEKQLVIAKPHHILVIPNSATLRRSR